MFFLSTLPLESRINWVGKPVIPSLDTNARPSPRSPSSDRGTKPAFMAEATALLV